MINTSLKKIIADSQHQERGAATLIVAVILLVSATLIIIFAANYSLLQQKTVANQNMSAQAFMAAEAGLEFGIQYLTTNSASIISTASAGVLNYGPADTNLTNVNLANNSRFSVVYTNPTVGSFTLLQVTATGISSDGSATRVVSQQVQSSSSLNTLTAFSVGNVTMSGNSTITNTVTNFNLQTGGRFNLSGGAYTITSSGTASTQGQLGSDVQENVSSLQNISESNFFTTVFGATKDATKSQIIASGNYFNNLSKNDYSTVLDADAGVAIWIDQTNGVPATINKKATIGTATNPVVLIVQGDLTIANNVVINGFVYVSGVLTNSGGIITGGIASAGTINLLNNSRIIYKNLTNSPLSMGAVTYAKVPGSWKDF